MARYIYVTLTVIFVGSLFGISQAYSASSHAVIPCRGCHNTYELDRAMKGRSEDRADQVTDSMVNIQGSYNMYISKTLDADSDFQPTGISKLCLSCHDGTISMMSRIAAIDVSRSHPISFVYDSMLAFKDGKLRDPSMPSGINSSIAEDLLDANGKMQCNSCHKVHTWGDEGKGEGFSTTEQLRKGEGEMCQICHIK